VSSGAFFVTTGTLEEHRPGEPGIVVSAGQSRVFGPDYAHDVRNVSEAPAISIHAYSPPLKEMNEYELEDDRLVLRGKEARNPEGRNDVGHIEHQESKARTGVLSVDETLAAARTRIDRLSPRNAYQSWAKDDAVLVDIRPERQRALEGSIAGAVVVERNVLEWRFDPASDSRLPVANSHDLQVIVFCSEGYTSSLAAAALQELGLWRATDIVGGFKAWRDAGLPTA
jgi:rhodanese-related sulfurtransferase